MGNKRLITFVFCLPVTIVLPTADAQRPVVTPSSAPAGAVSAPRRATEDDPIYAEIFRVWSGGDQAKAEQMLDQAVRLNPANVRLAFFHAACTRSRFDVSGALPLFRAVVSASPDSAEGQCSQIMMKLDSGTDVASQFASLLRLADDCADDPLITWMVGVQSRSLNRNEIGVKYYQRLSGMVDPGPSLMHQTFANLLDEVKRYDEALVHRKIVVKQEPAPWSYEGLGNTLQSLARYEEACAAYTKALEMSPNDPRLLWDLGDTLYHVRKYNASIEKLKQAASVAPDDLRILNTWGLCLSELNYWDQALDKYAQARRADPKSPYPYRNAIYLLRSLGRDEEAARIEDDWKRANGSAPLNPRP